MDLGTLILPGAQSLVSQILSDGWTQARTWLASRLVHPGNVDRADFERQLDAAHDLANGIPVPASGMPAETARRLVLDAYWAGYLDALSRTRPEMVRVLTELTGHAATAAPDQTTINSLTGKVAGNVVQAGNIQGGIRFT